MGGYPPGPPRPPLMDSRRPSVPRQPYYPHLAASRPRSLKAPLCGFCVPITGPSGEPYATPHVSTRRSKKRDDSGFDTYLGFCIFIAKNPLGAGAGAGSTTADSATVAPDAPKRRGRLFSPFLGFETPTVKSVRKQTAAGP